MFGLFCFGFGFFWFFGGFFGGGCCFLVYFYSPKGDQKVNFLIGKEGHLITFQ